MSIYIEDVNESPTSLHITDKHGWNTFSTDHAFIEENLPTGYAVGTIQALDQDTVTDLVFSLVDDAGQRFRLDGKVTCKNLTQNQCKFSFNEVKNKQYFNLPEEFG